MLWLITTFPSWAFHLVLGAGIVALFVAAMTSKIPGISLYSLELKMFSLMLIVAGLMLEGAMSLQKDYVIMEAALKEQILIAEAKSATIVTKIVEQVVYRDRVIVKQGADTIRYIDREVAKIDSTCILSKEAVVAHNAAAAPTDTGATK